MDIHIAVRDIVDQVGTGVLSDPDNFRGVLDDVLDEDAADAGEVNLLVDAVRFGAVAQLVRLLDSDADMVRAVETAASGFARLRGGADPNASRWACAVLGFAIRRVPEGLVIDLASRLPSRRDTVQPAPATRSRPTRSRPTRSRPAAACPRPDPAALHAALCAASAAAHVHARAAHLRAAGRLVAVRRADRQPRRLGRQGRCGRRPGACDRRGRLPRVGASSGRAAARGRPRRPSSS